MIRKIYIEYTHTHTYIYIFGCTELPQPELKPLSSAASTVLTTGPLKKSYIYILKFFIKVLYCNYSPNLLCLIFLIF